MKSKTIVNEETREFYVRLRRMARDYWYLSEENGTEINQLVKVDLPNTLKNKEILINKISIFNHQIWYHFNYGSISGWLLKKHLKNNFRRLTIEPIKQNSESDIDNECAAFLMMLRYAGSSISPTQLKNEILKLDLKQSNMLSLGQVVINETDSIKDLSKMSFKQIKRQILRKRPIVIKTSGLNNLKSNIIIIVGFNHKTYYFNNPWTGSLESLTQQQLKKLWIKGNLEAISY
ncbi:C39 family peptidase [Lentilactobacillus laojiaonis]|uniref:C39 family peptidase n=1 Tax=Lentilactobacillus laojiaonis TaxID=2883998 RepID=UPI001D0A7AD9|nr:C39 family peptidase [Lentilactobacillus laojiaonis]UDM31780.1 C39 family peptidase [Lentilactobacillus laojiaonis]